MNKNEKLDFIKKVVKYREQGYMGPGCSADWFYETYEEYNDYKGDLPKYVVFYHKGYKTDECSMLVSERLYCNIGPQSIYLDEKNYNLFKQGLPVTGRRITGDYELHFDIVDEDYYIDRMYDNAFRYMEKDIKPMLKKRQEKINRENNIREIYTGFFKLEKGLE